MEPTYERADGARPLVGHEGDGGSERRLWAAAVVSVSILIVEIVGGIMANSLALLSDAGHVFLDIFSVGLALSAARFCRLPAQGRSSFGMHRAEILAALVNAFTLIGLSVVIFYEAYQRLQAPPEVRASEMLVVAVTGLAANLVGVYLLHGGRDINVRGAYIHILGDTGSSVAVIAGAVVIMYTGERRVDPVLSALIGVLILYGAGRLIREAVDILLERTPRDIDPRKVEKKLLATPGVATMHDMHIWSLCSNVRAFSAHLVLDEVGQKDRDTITRGVRAMLRDDFSITYVTVQYEDQHCCESHGP
jgi:cobalt-zinc-cadmium efflux system protein